MTASAREKSLRMASEAKSDLYYFRREQSKRQDRSDRREAERKALENGVNAIFEEYRKVYHYAASFQVCVRTRELKKLIRKFKRYKPLLNDMEYRIEKITRFPKVKILFRKQK